MTPNAPHQKLIDGLNVLLLRDYLTKHEAVEIIMAYEDQPEDQDEAVLFQLYKDLGINI